LHVYHRGGMPPSGAKRPDSVRVSDESYAKTHRSSMSASMYVPTGVNTDTFRTSAQSMRSCESSPGYPSCIFIKNRDVEPDAPADTAITSFKVDTLMPRQRGGGGARVEGHDHTRAVGKPANSLGETTPPGTPSGTQTGAKAAISRLYQQFTPRRMQTRLPSFSLPTLPSHTRSRVAPNSANAPSATKDGFLTAVRSPQSDEEAKAECLAIRREAASTHIQSVARARLTRCMSAPATLREPAKSSTEDAPPPAAAMVDLKLKSSWLPKPTEASAGGGGVFEHGSVRTPAGTDVTDVAFVRPLRERGGGRGPPPSAGDKAPMEAECNADTTSLSDIKTLLASMQTTISQLAAQQMALADTVASTNANISTRLNSLESQSKVTHMTDKPNQPATVPTQQPTRKTTQTPQLTRPLAVALVRA
jgi:hypothetical protein